VFYLGVAFARVERQLVILSVSAGNVTLCRGLLCRAVLEKVSNIELKKYSAFNALIPGYVQRDGQT
jgi:hypothetical protein